MRDVFLLGAGFSKAANENMPLLTELSEKVRCKVNNFPDWLLELGSNIELWLTYLSQPQPWLRERHNLENRALFLELGEGIKDVLEQTTDEALQRDCPEWLTQLVRWWHENKASVITFNYDTIVERVATQIASDETRKLLPEHIYPVPLTEVRRRNATIIGGEPVKSFKLFKLHGSVNWYYSGADQFYGEILYYGIVEPWGAKREGENRSKMAALDKVPLVVPPTIEKGTYFKHETLRQLWFMAGQALSSAERIYCVGYSLPLTDVAIRFFLQRNSPGKATPLFVVNKDHDAPKRYNELLGNSYSIRDNYIGDEAISRLITDLSTRSKGG